MIYFVQYFLQSIRIYNPYFISANPWNLPFFAYDRTADGYETKCSFLLATPRLPQIIRDVLILRKRRNALAASRCFRRISASRFTPGDLGSSLRRVCAGTLNPQHLTKTGELRLSADIDGALHQVRTPLKLRASTS